MPQAAGARLIDDHSKHDHNATSREHARIDLGGADRAAAAAHCPPSCLCRPRRVEVQNTLFIFAGVARDPNYILAGLFHLAIDQCVDDVPQLEPSSSATSARVAVDSVLDFLGWDIKVQDGAAAEFQEVAPALGVRFVHSGVGHGEIAICRRAGKAEAVIASMRQIAEEGVLRLLVTPGHCRLAPFGGRGARGLKYLADASCGAPALATEEAELLPVAVTCGAWGADGRALVFVGSDAARAAMIPGSGRCIKPGSLLPAAARRRGPSGVCYVVLGPGDVADAPARLGLACCRAGSGLAGDGAQVAAARSDVEVAHAETGSVGALAEAPSRGQRRPGGCALTCQGSGGHGTGVLRAYYACYLIRGLTVGIAGASSLAISEATGLPQNLLVASRGVGLVLGPTALSPLIGRLLWSGNSEAGVAGALALKMACELVIPPDKPAAPVPGFPPRGHVHGHAGHLRHAADRTSPRSAGREGLPHLRHAVRDRLHARPLHRGHEPPAVLARACRRRLRDLRGPGGEEAAARQAPGLEAEGARRRAAERAAGARRRGRARGGGRAPAAAGAGAAGGPAFSFAVQVTMTAVSCWAFTYAVCSLGLPQRVAAAVPAVFYASCTLARVALVPVSSRLLPSTIMHAGALLAGSAAVLFYWVDGWLVEQAARGQAPGRGCQGLLLACFAMMGAGFCPHHTMTIAAMQRHGTLSPQVHGWYGTSTCLGITFGMFLPGMFGLPLI
ncbi:unnamed protein product, partial [Prorocentrum cordatum]